MKIKNLKPFLFRREEIKRKKREIPLIFLQRKEW
jgi:hypothetical protein